MKKELTAGLFWAGSMIALALAARLAMAHGLIDGDTVKRLVFAMTGLMITWYGNRIPKAAVPHAGAAKAARVAGWSQVLSGLTYTGLWAFAPIHTAIVFGTGAVIAGIVVTLAYCLRLRTA